MQRATELTPDPARRAVRALAAAQAKFDAGTADEAYRLLATAEAGPLGDLQHAWLERLRARLGFSLVRGRDAPPLLLSAARRLAPLDAVLARDTYLEAAGAAIFAGRLGGSAGVRKRLRRLVPLLQRRSRHGRSTSSLTVSRRDLPTATRPAWARSGGRCTHPGESKG